MNARLMSLAIGIPLVLASTALAKDRRPLREAFSENNRFRIRIRPGHGAGNSAARATLLERVGKDKRERSLWRTKLVNEVAPRHAVVRDDGRFVVTLDEFRRGGAAHTVVVYGRDGRRLREFGLRELLSGEDWKEVKREQRAVEWLSGATFAFKEAPPQFVITLGWKRRILIDLDQLEVTTADERGGAERAQSGNSIPREILALLQLPSTVPAGDAATADTERAEAMQCALQALQQIAKAFGLNVATSGFETAAGSESAVVDEQGKTGDIERAGTGSDGPRALAADADASNMGDDPQSAFAGNSAAAGWAVPMPDPANPVDYVAWVIEQTVTEGPSAIPLYEAAAEAHVGWEGDQELYEAAMRGNREALASPEIGVWLEANREALAHFRAATQLEYRGQMTPGENGMVVDIMLPSLASKRWLAKAAIIEAKYLEANGEVEAAMGSYLDNMVVGTQVSQGPTIIENLVGIAVQALTANGLLDSLASQTGQDIDCAQLAHDLENKYRPVRPMVETFQGERACGLDMIQRLYEWNPETRQYDVSESGLQRLGVIFEDLDPGSDFPNSTEFRSSLEAAGFEKMVAEANRVYDRMTETAFVPYQESRQIWNELEGHIGSPEFAESNPLLSTLMPSLARATHLSTRASAIRNATRLVANLKAYHQQHGAYPDSLDVFGDSDMVLDAFTGDRLVYRRDADDFTLYSLGGDGVDDGGLHDRRGDTNDIQYWPRPPSGD